LQTDSNDLLKPEKAFEWANQAGREKNWSVAAQRWAVLRRAYPDHPDTWFQGANAHIEAGELEQAEALISHTRQHFPNNPGNLIDASSLAMGRLDWDAAEVLLQKSREKHPDNLQTWMKPAECAENLLDWNAHTPGLFCCFHH
jgi:tetratricopeptide (TPR) repeat protein